MAGDFTTTETVKAFVKAQRLVAKLEKSRQFAIKSAFAAINNRNNVGFK